MLKSINLFIRITNYIINLLQIYVISLSSAIKAINYVTITKKNRSMQQNC